MAILIDSFDVTPYDVITFSTPHPSITTSSSSLGQTFKLLNSYKLSSVKFLLKRSSGTFTGTLKAYLYVHSGTFGSTGIPTSPILAESNPINLSDIPITPYTWIEFTFDGTFTLVENIPYCIVIYSTNGNLDGSHYVWVANKIGGTHNGNGVYYKGTTLWDWSTRDYLFYLYGEEIEEEELPPIRVQGKGKSVKPTLKIDYWSNYLDYGTMRAAIQQALEETKPIISSLKKTFSETINVKAKIAETFEETMPLTASVLQEFTESLYVEGNIIKSFQETVSTTSDIMKAVIVDEERITGNVTSLSEKLKELKRKIKKI